MSGSPSESPRKIPVGRLALVEFSAPTPRVAALDKVFQQIGMTPVARHRNRDATLYRQGDVVFVINVDPASFAAGFAELHGPSIAGIAIPVDDPASVRGLALERGAAPYTGTKDPILDCPIVEGVGRSLIYLVDRNRPDDLLRDFVPIPGAPLRPPGFGMTHVDHVTHCVSVPEMKFWVDFYRTIFGFSIVFEFIARGKASGFHTQAVRDDDMNMCVTILEPTGPESQIQEFMDEYHGPGIQHVALASNDLASAVERMIETGVDFLPTPGSYYDGLAERLPAHGEDSARLQRLGIMLDGTTATQSPDGSPHLLLQIFTRKMIGPIFFEAIERRGNHGFGEGNAQALFDAVEREQLARRQAR